MSSEELFTKIPHGELIVPHGHLSLKSIFQFTDADEVYAFLYGCRKASCSVYFQNEDICVGAKGDMSVPKIAIAVYMQMKENPAMVASYLGFLSEAASGKCSLDSIDVI